MELAAAIFTLLLAVASAVISVFQFREKGFPINNAYLYASRQERENMDKTPHFRQSGTVFALISVIFLCLAAQCILKAGWLWWLEGALTAITLIYAVVSSVRGQMRS